MSGCGFKLSGGVYSPGVKDSFDWVEARAKCNLRILFDDLRKVVEANVQSARIHVAPDVVLDEPAPGRFVVRVPFAGRSDLPGLSGSFELSEEDSAIKVFGPDSMLFFVARANLADEDCRLEVQTCGVSPVAEPLSRARPMGLGEFSREVLESIFFRGR